MRPANSPSWSLHSHAGYFRHYREDPAGKNGEVQITDALLEQAKNGCVLAYQFKGRRFDCGSIDGFVEATNYVYENIYKKGK